MEYRALGRTGLEVTAIGFGTEYLIGQAPEHIASVIQGAVDRGINYFDLFYAGASFRDAMGAAFRGRRHRVLLAAHLGSIEVNGQYGNTREPEQAAAWFHDFLRRYETDHADVLFVHNVDSLEDYARVMGPNGLLELAQSFVREGKARAIGFSSHVVATAQRAVDSGQFDVLMFPINLAGHAVPGRKELFLACLASGVGLIAMKPFGGGKLLQPERVVEVEEWRRGGQAVRLERHVPITPVQCLAYVLGQPGLSTVVPGCKNLDELGSVLSYYAAPSTEKDFAPILSDFAEYAEGECVYCNHCQPCPVGIDIGRTIRLLEESHGRPSAEQREAYASLSAEPSGCVECGACQDRCPFGVQTVAKIVAAAAVFASDPSPASRAGR